ncbi:MAG: glycosyltransferase family 39 protein [Candidatus Omnitrophota bacterium]|nr:glycosyltransferase family 39 protein [Candidatus Omnitrophota bacterium]
MRRRNYLFLILIILSFHVFLNYQVLKKSNIIRMDDEGGTIIAGLNCYNIIFLDHSIKLVNKLGFILGLHGQCHPRFVELAEALSWKALNLFKILDITSMILVVNAIFFIILLGSVYGIGSIVYNRNVGILSAALVSMFPLVFGHSRLAMRDFPLMCMVSLGFYLLLKAGKFSSSLYSVLSGVVFGLAQLTKETAFIFFLTPLIYYFTGSYSLDNKKKVLRNFIVTLACFLILTGVVYFRLENLHAFKIYFGKTCYIRNYPNFFYYLKNFIEITGPFILIISLPLFVQYLVNIKRREKILFVWFIIPIILFSITPNKAIRFLFPILPAFALIVSSEIANINLSKEFKKVFYIMLISISILQYAFFNAGILDTKFKNPYFEAGILSVRKDKYLPEYMRLLDVFKKEAKNNNVSGNKNVVFLFNIREIYWPFWLDTWVYKMPFNVSNSLLVDEVDVINTYHVDWDKEILKADYIVNKTGFKERQDYRNHILDGLEKGFIKYKDRFELIADIKLLFDNSAVYVYKKVSHN